MTELSAEGSDASPGTVRQVGIAEYVSARGGTQLTTSGLGSCVGVALFDRDSDVAGLVHVMLPSRDSDTEEPDAKFADSGVSVLLKDMQTKGASPETVIAKIAGGSSLLDSIPNDEAIGDRNVDAVERSLADHDIPLVAAAVGGDHGRSITVDPIEGTMVVKNAHGTTQTL